jgi:hypothetical protein
MNGDNTKLNAQDRRMKVKNITLENKYSYNPSDISYLTATPYDL